MQLYQVINVEDMPENFQEFLEGFWNELSAHPYIIWDSHREHDDIESYALHQEINNWLVSQGCDFLKPILIW